MTMITAIYLTLFILYGVVFGSFLNVCVYRIPKNISVAKGRSFCPSCGHCLQAKDLIPVIGYLLLGRKCRYCKTKIPFRYAKVEMLTGFIFGITYMTIGLNPYTVLVCLLACILILVSFIDIDTGEIPDRLHVFILILAIINICFSVFLNEYPWGLPLTDYLIGFLIISLPMLILAYFTAGFGGGDIKLMAVVGLFLGWQSVVLAFLIGAFLGGIYGVYLILRYKADGKSSFSFGPHLCIGIFICNLWGEQLIELYLDLVGL